MSSARIWRCVKQNFMRSVASFTLSLRILQKEVLKT